MNRKDRRRFIFALSKFEKIQIQEDDKKFGKTWSVCSIIWTKALEGDKDALAMVNELFINKDEIEMFLETSKAGNHTMTCSAICILCFGLEDKLDEIFSQ